MPLLTLLSHVSPFFFTNTPGFELFHLVFLLLRGLFLSSSFLFFIPVLCSSFDSLVRSSGTSWNGLSLIFKIIQSFPSLSLYFSWFALCQYIPTQILSLIIYLSTVYHSLKFKVLDIWEIIFVGLSVWVVGGFVHAGQPIQINAYLRQKCSYQLHFWMRKQATREWSHLHKVGTEPHSLTYMIRSKQDQNSQLEKYKVSQ